MDRFLGFSLDQLTIFVAAIDSGSFTAASRRVGRVQSAVSTAVHKLEESLGTPLFERVGRQVVPTEAGRRLAGEARLVLAQARGVEQCAASLRSGVEPRLTVALDALFPRRVLVHACRELYRRFPTVSVRLREDLLGDIVALVADGAADLGISNVEVRTGDELVTRPCREVRLVPVCARDHALAELADAPPEHLLRSAVQIVLSERGAASTDDYGVLASRTWRVTDLETKLGLIQAGVGWGSMPLEMVAAALDRGDLVRLYPAPWPDGHRIELRSVVRAGHPLGPAGRWLEGALADR
jgi:DNA-binding transcriptional LysR family regulator